MSLRNYKEFGKLTARIERAVAAGNISHAYIVEGDSCIDKKSFAKDFVKAVLCPENPGTGCDSCVTCRKIDQPRCDENSNREHSATVSAKIACCCRTGHRHGNHQPQHDLSHDAAEKRSGY